MPDRTRTISNPPTAIGVATILSVVPTCAVGRTAGSMSIPGSPNAGACSTRTASWNLPKGWYRTTMATAIDLPELDEACEISAEMRALRQRIKALGQKRRMLWLRASRNGATYVHITQQCGVSEAVLTREIRQARQEVNDPALAARAPRRRT